MTPSATESVSEDPDAPAAEHTAAGQTMVELVQAAGNGNRGALETVVRFVSNDVYRLALRMTGNVPDAEDATQEILIKVITRLGSYRGDAAVLRRCAR